MAVLPDDQRAASTPDIDTLIKQQQPLLRANFQTMLPLGYAKIYRNLSTAELESYLREARKPALQRFSKVYTSAFTAAMGKQAVGVGVAFGKALRASRI